MSTQPMVKDFFDPKTNTFSYVVSDPATKQCAISTVFSIMTLLQQ